MYSSEKEETRFEFGRRSTEQSTIDVDEESNGEGN